MLPSLRKKREGHYCNCLEPEKNLKVPFCFPDLWDINLKKEKEGGFRIKCICGCIRHTSRALFLGSVRVSICAICGETKCFYAKSKKRLDPVLPMSAAGRDGDSGKGS